MAWGARINNQSGFVQIDQDYSNYALVATGTRSSFLPVSYSSFTTQPPVLFARPVAGTGIVRAVLDFSAQTFAVYGAIGVNPPEAIRWAMFAPSNTVAENSDTFGFRVFKQNSEVSFSSRHTPVRVHTMSTHTFANANSPAINLPYPSGVTPWGFCNPLSMAMFVNPYQSPEYNFLTNQVQVRIGHHGIWQPYTVDFRNTRTYMVGSIGWGV